MKKLFIVLLAFTALISCNNKSATDNIKVNFESPFHRHAKNLTFKLGNEFSIKHNNDTLTFLVTFNKKIKVNYIVDKTENDTVFSGIVSKYKGLYFFNRQINDSSYWIYAVEINNGTIKGQGTDWIQMAYLSEEVEKSLHTNSALKKLVKSVNKDTSAIRLIPDKKILKDFYYSILDSLPTDTFISGFDYENYSELDKPEDIIQTFEIEETFDNKMILNLYPNPADEFITIETDKPNESIYMILNVNGQLVMSGKLVDKISKIDVSELKTGIYFIELYKENGKSETKKLIIR